MAENSFLASFLFSFLLYTIVIRKGVKQLNHVGLVGRLTKDPELKYFNEKRPFSVFTLAINRSYKNTQGTVDADFIQCVAWGKLAETISKYCGKGSMIGVNGRLNTKSYVNQEKKRIYSIDVVAEDVRFYKLKTPSTASMDLSDFEVPEEHSLPENQYTDGKERIQNSERNHSVVAESSTLSESDDQLPIPS